MKEKDNPSYNDVRAAVDLATKKAKAADKAAVKAYAAAAGAKRLAEYQAILAVESQMALQKAKDTLSKYVSETKV